MQSRALEILVGFFICLGVAAVFILTMRVSNLERVAGLDGYTVTASFTNIGGLRVGAPVDLAGVRIGRVTNIQIDQRTYKALVSIRIRSGYKIPKDSDARILTAGLLGEQYIGIGAGASEDYLETGDTFMMTQSAVILEELIGQFMTQMANRN